MPLLLTAIVLMLVMAVGGVFATQSVQLDNKGEHSVEQAYNVTLTRKEGDKTINVLTDGVFTEPIAWCPGRTEIVYLTLTNNEAFPVIVELSLVGNKNETGAKHLNDYLTYALREYNPNETQPANWIAFCEGEVVMGTMPQAGVTKNMLTLNPMGTGETNARTYAFAIHLDEATPDDYQEAEMSFSFNMTVKSNYKPSFDPNAKTPDSGSSSAN